jgi:hypothetical protein
VASDPNPSVLSADFAKSPREEKPAVPIKKESTPPTAVPAPAVLAGPEDVLAQILKIDRYLECVELEVTEVMVSSYWGTTRQAVRSLIEQLSQKDEGK